jgi:hypothetical protein
VAPGLRTWAVLAATEEEARAAFLAHLEVWQAARAVLERIERVGSVLGLD